MIVVHTSRRQPLVVIPFEMTFRWPAVDGRFQVVQFLGERQGQSGEPLSDFTQPEAGVADPPGVSPEVDSRPLGKHSEECDYEKSSKYHLLPLLPLMPPTATPTLVKAAIPVMVVPPTR